MAILKVCVYECVCVRACVCVCARAQRDGERERELRSCVEVEAAVLGSPSLIVRTVSVDVKQQ